MVALDPSHEAAFNFLRDTYGAKGGDWERVVVLAEKLADSGASGSAYLLATAGNLVWKEMGDLIRARSFFEKLAALTPVISQEAVIAAAPEVIVAADFEPGPASAADASPLQMWRSWPGLPANSLDGLFVIDPDLLNVPGPRMVRGIAELCADIDAVRRKKGARTSLPPAQH